MTPRDPAERRRAATSLDLLFDLCFAVAVYFAASHLHAGLAAGDCAHAVLWYSLIFFAICWAWMNVTWWARASTWSPNCLGARANGPAGSWASRSRRLRPLRWLLQQSF
jgi:hypothetical protein